jgi:anthranilate synthase component 2
MEPGVELDVVRNNDSFLDQIEQKVYDGIIIGPGPGSPEDKEYFGNCQWVLDNFSKHNTPILGICLGFQGIFATFGGALRISNVPMHGKTSNLRIISEGSILNNISNNVKVMRYHSILADVTDLEASDIVLLAEVETSASTKANGREVMAIRHKSLPIYGLQFHPESFATDNGSQYAQNFIEIVNYYPENVAKKSL